MVAKYALKEGLTSDVSWLNYSTQYDDRSAAINYSLVRHFKPTVVVEFGTRTGRCTNDILTALLKNKKKYIYKPYELEDDNRTTAQNELDKRFGKIVKIGGNIMEADDLPDGIEYLFIDNYHDILTTNWVFDTLIKKCKPGALVQIHDLRLKGNVEEAGGSLPEQKIILDLFNAGKLPLEKLYFTYEEGEGMESSWWLYKP